MRMWKGTQRQRCRQPGALLYPGGWPVTAVGAWQSANRRGGPCFTDTTMGAQPPSLLSPSERLRRIRKRPQRIKDNFLCDLIMHAAAEKQELKEWWDSEKRDRTENAEHQNKSVMKHQADTLQALQTKQLRAHPPLQPLSQNSFPCTPQTPPTRSYQPPGSSLYPLHSTPAPSQSSPEDSQYPVHSTPVPLQFSPAEVQYPLHCTPKDKVAYNTWTYTNF
ncbi:uncharacterized protein LOC123355819 [Mauremys mutica]|uniref:uncharacterized protein LOC123355819 n=1 Tax=Mauremys mutica TaxID=74926 RepID=UPI001D1648A2|nr:uncharacterized protein LOC123355819 [Mauremys mutica]